MKIKIGDLVEFAAEYKDVSLTHNQEVDISDLKCYIDAPAGPTLVQYIIKKENLQGRKLSLASGKEVKCADKHILRTQGVDIFADEIFPGDFVDTLQGPDRVISITKIPNQDFYDIGVPAPHLYYDDQGILHHNTLITASMSSLVEPYGRTIVIVPNKDLVTQTEKDYRNLGLDVGVFYGERKEYNRTHTICTWQSLEVLVKNTAIAERDKGHLSDTDKMEMLLRGDCWCCDRPTTDHANGCVAANGDVHDFVRGVIAVIVDEVHKAKADVLRTQLKTIFRHVPIRWGLTGTVPKTDYERYGVVAGLGPVVGQLRSKTLQDQGVLAQLDIEVLQLQDPIMSFGNYAAELKWITTNRKRLDYIRDVAERLAKDGNTLILVDRIETGRILVERNPDWVFISGQVASKNRQTEYDDVSSADNKVIVATYGVAAVGINIPRIFNLMLVEPGKSFVRVIQSIGRGIRRAKDKDSVKVIDVCSSHKYSKRHLTERKKYYREQQFPFKITKVKY